MMTGGVSDPDMQENDNSKRIDSTDRAVSPVIGVILMVAITVILAAVIGTFVLDLGQTAGQAAPSATLSVNVDASANHITIDHGGGDALVASESRLTITNESSGNSTNFEGGNAPDTFTVGDTVEANPNMPNINSSTWGTMTDTSGAGTDIVSGNQYTVTVIDLDTQRVIYETTVTA